MATTTPRLKHTPPIPAIIAATPAEVKQAGVYIPPPPAIVMGCPVCGVVSSVTGVLFSNPVGPSIGGVPKLTCGHRVILSGGKWWVLAQP